MGKRESNEAAGVTAAQQQANPAFTGQMRTFGAGQASMVQNQLNQAGLGGMVDPTQYRATTIPIITRPNEIEAYLQSLGLTPATVNTAASTSSATSEENPLSKYSEDF